MTVECLRLGTLRKAALCSKYLALRISVSGKEFGINSDVLNMHENKKRADNFKTDIISWREINIQEYITLKTTFL